ncbi:MAG: methionyl-tRNA formyltransferase [Sciscionella sp.]
MRLVFAGTPEAALPSLRALIASPRHDVVAVVTRPDVASGRGRKVHRSPVAALAGEHGIEVLTPRRAGDQDFLTRLGELAPDCCPVVAYGALLPQSVLDVPSQGWVNLHFSLLPAWRGAAPVQAAVMAGDEFTGASTFRIVKALDAGPLFGVLTERIGERDTAGELLLRLAVSGAELLLSTLDGIADGTLRAVPQPAEGVSYAGKVGVDDAHVDFRAPAHAVDRQIRAVTPDPGAWAMFRGERVKLFPAQTVAEDVERVAPGDIVVRRKQVLVGTASHPLRLGEVQAAGKRKMAATDWARGTRIECGEALL